MIYDYVPLIPGDCIDWLKFESEYHWTKTLAQTPQDPKHHSEGDVWTHTKMVAESLIGLPSFWDLDPIGQRVTFASALLHDIAKPATTVHQEDGRITSHGHSKRGAGDARLLLWREKVPFAEREMIARIIGVHQIPFFAMKQGDFEFRHRKLSHILRLDWLSLMAQADALGRTTNPAEERSETLNNVELFNIACEIDGIIDTPYPFASGSSWMRYLDVKGVECDPRYHIKNIAMGSRVLFMSGLPGMGKDTWIEEHAKDLPVVSLDTVRLRMGLEHGENQGAMAQVVKEHARSLLRDKKDFVWNATNFTASMREMTINLLREYGAHVTIIYVETSDEKKWRQQNKQRQSSLPDKALDAMLFKWEPPNENEAHGVQYWIDGVLEKVVDCTPTGYEASISRNN